MRFRCVNGILVARRLNPESVTAGGIILPDGAQKKSELAVVLESCPEWTEEGKTRQTMLKSGDIICISKYSGQEFELDGKHKVVLVKEKDILCILDDFEPSQAPAIPVEAPAAVPFWGDGITTL
jgi:chaperonin GroES